MMLCRYYVLIACGFVFGFLVSCQQKQAEKVELHHSKGQPCELLVVTDRIVEGSDVNDSLKEFTDECLPCVMQYEPMFSTVHVHEDKFTRRYITMHTQLRVHVDKTLDRPMIGVARNKHAIPQTEVTVAAPDLDALRLYFHEQKGKILDILQDSQLRYCMSELAGAYNVSVDGISRKHMGYTLHVPKLVKATKQGRDFLWTGSNLDTEDMNVVIYEYPFDGFPLGDMTRYVHVRDSVMKCNIPGDKPGQWMQTAEIDGVPVVLERERKLNGKTYMEVRGMWQMRNAALGGPFVSLLSVDTASNTVLATEGFIYSPSTGKRDLIQRVEASLLTIKKQK